MDNKAIFIQARSGSSRLPGKVLLTVKGLPLILHLIKRVRLSTATELIVLCTTNAQTDDKLAAVGHKAGIEVFRGSELDVAQRLLHAAEKFSVDFFVVVEGDEIFVEARFIDAVFRLAETTDADLVETKGLPIGAWVYGVRTAALHSICSEANTVDLDGWTNLFAQDPRFTQAFVEADEAIVSVSGSLRLTVDYPEDIELVRAIFARLYRPEEVFSLDEVLDLFHREPELININRHLTEVYWRRFHERSRREPS